jgi:hypothetical protein
VAHGIPEGVGDGGTAGIPQIEIDPEAFPLAPLTKGRTVLLKGSGNAIVPQVAAMFLRAVIGDETTNAAHEAGEVQGE